MEFFLNVWYTENRDIVPMNVVGLGLGIYALTKGYEYGKNIF
jgi:hypothetical protein